MENDQQLMPAMKLHPDDEQLERYSMDTMSTREVAHFEEHTLICETCQGRLLHMDGYIESMRRAALAYRREQSSRRAGAKAAVALASAGN
jgi:hypothetical protein